MDTEADHSSPEFFIGTSGWAYDHWRGFFYPENLAKKRWFDFYAGRFNAVEVNATFYRSFKDQTYLNWKERAPRGFTYVLKVPGLITHRKLLRDAEGDIQSFCSSAALLGEKFGMFLLQAPPNLPHDRGLLRAALMAFDDLARVAVEFRDDWWFSRDTETLLCSTGASFCNVDSPRRRLGDILTSERAYLRLHGRRRWYASDYSMEELRQTAEIVRGLASRGAKEIYVFFNNDLGGYAPANAMALKKLSAGDGC